jgi:hypothetical protein
MANFVKGDWVRVSPSPDLFWKYWTEKHSSYCGQVVEVMDVQPSKNYSDVLFLSLKHFDGESKVWFQDKHCVIEESYDRVFAANMQRACDRLNANEATAKKCRDEVLKQMFGPDDVELIEEVWDDDDDEFFDELDDDQYDDEDEYAEDWENVVTKPVVPLPGKKKKKKKTIRRKTKGGNVIKKALNDAKKKLANATLDTRDMEPEDWMSAEEIENYYQSFDDKDTVWGDPD